MRPVFPEVSKSYLNLLSRHSREVSEIDRHGKERSVTALLRKPCMRCWRQARKYLLLMFASLWTCWETRSSSRAHRGSHPRMCMRILRCVRKSETWWFTAPVPVIKPAEPSCIERSPWILATHTP